MSPKMSDQIASRVVIVSGGSNGIGAAVVAGFNRQGAIVIIVDLLSTESSARKVIESLSSPSNARFMLADITDWDQLREVFRTVHLEFGCIDLVIANAGSMEHQPTVEDSFDENGELEAPTEAYRTIDVNLKGCLNSMSLSALVESDDGSDHFA